MDAAARIDTARRYLRRTYAQNLTGLLALADQVANTATEAVTLTGQSFEGGSHTGQLTFEPMAYLTAIEDIIAELDPTGAGAPPPDRAYARLSASAAPSPYGLT